VDIEVPCPPASPVSCCLFFVFLNT